MNRAKIILALGFLVSVSQAFSSELASLIRPMGGEIGVKLSRHTVYVRKNATDASSAWKIINENTKKIDGISTISETKLPKNQAVVFDKIAIGFAEGAAAGKEGALNYGVTTVPAVLRNANIVITQNGREVLDLPVADLVKGQSSNASEDLYHDLEGFNYLVDDQPMDWTFRFPEGASFAPSALGKFNYVEVRLQGFKTARKQ
jgi:hypothetical protein